MPYSPLPLRPSDLVHDQADPLPDTSRRLNLDDIDEATFLRIKRIASRFVRLGVNPTLGPTAMAIEVWIRLRKSKSALQVHDPQHFDAIVGQTAGFVAKDSARQRLSIKRDSGGFVVTDLDRQAAQQASTETLLTIKLAIDALAAEDQETADVLHDFYFEGKRVAEIAADREISKRTVERILSIGRAWIHDRMTRRPNEPPSDEL
jgi:DNA-directed RNA polymerase specialized sigma24 family protein